jgi:hypothetical protein
LHVRADRTRVRLQLLELVHEVGVCEVRGRLGVGGELLDHVGVVEHATEAAVEAVILCFGFESALDSVEA